MLPAQFIVLLILAALPAELAAAARAEGRGIGTPDASTIRLALFAYGSLFLMNALLAFEVISQARRTIRSLLATADATSDILGKIDGAVTRARLMTIILTGAILFATPFPEVFFFWRDQIPFAKHIPLLSELVFLAPAILAWIGIWTAAYRIEAAGRQRSLAHRLDRGLPVHEMPPLRSYLLMQSRHNFFPLVFIFLATTMDKLTPANSKAAAFIGGLGGVMMLIAVPMILTKIWSTTPLPGDLRDRLVGVARRYRLRFRDILLWKTHHLTLNAAILGWFPGTRYFLMSDVLLETNTDRQIEAIFAHEVGHGVHRHIPWYMAMVGAAMMFATGIAQVATVLNPALAANDEMAGVAIMLGLTLLIGGYCIYTIAPQFEHQADWFACRHMARVQEESPQEPVESTLAVMGNQPVLSGALLMAPGVAEQVTMSQYIAGAYPHNRTSTPGTMVAEEPLASPKNALEAGSEVFISALLSIVDKTQRAHDKRDIMHPSIRDRVTFLRKLARDEAAEKAFERKISRAKRVIVGMVIVGGATLAAAAMLPTPASANPGAPATQPHAAVSPE